MHYRFGTNIEESIYIRVYPQRLQGNYGSYWAVATSVGEVILQSLDHVISFDHRCITRLTSRPLVTLR